MNYKEKEINELIEEKQAFQEELKAKANDFAMKIKAGIGEDMKEYLENPPRPPKKTFFEKLCNLWKKSY